MTISKKVQKSCTTVLCHQLFPLGSSGIKIMSRFFKRKCKMRCSCAILFSSLVIMIPGENSVILP